MTRKHFELIANALKALGEQKYIDNAKDARAFLIGYFCMSFELENSKFDRAKFMKACGIK